MKPKMYIETTIPSYLTAWPSRNLLRAAHQRITREWWTGRDKFDLYTSRVVIEECQAGDTRAAADRLSALAGMLILEVTPAAVTLAEGLMRGVRLPEVAATDAFHVSIAAVEGMDYLLTWNCAHIANAAFLPRIAAVCLTAGYTPPMIDTPEQSMIRSHADD